MWGVQYSTRSICALEGTSAVMSCNYTYPPGLTVKEVFWTKYGWVPWYGRREYIDLSQYPNYKDRLHADCGDKKSRCFLNITRLNKSDAHEYNCRIITVEEGEIWISQPGIMLSITDLKVEIVGAATEGNDVRLECKTSCNLSSSPTYSWKKNGEPLEMEPTKNNELLLHPVSSEDGGRYSCAVKGHEDLSSAEVELSVRYSPKNPRVLVAPPAEIPEGGSVTLSCSSDANPPVQNYTWFKENVTSPVAAGQNYTITNFTSAQVGLYSCQARNEVGVQNSTAVPLTVHGSATPPMFLYAVRVAVASSCIISGFFIWRCKRDRKTRREAAEKTDDNENVQYEEDKSDQISSVYQSLNLNTTGHDDVYQSLHPQTNKTAA
ncbi:sialoadhesin-like isoform X2 [Denticeps clupeoides]|uniref:Ig-like domain-containing protein n=2 Tax=Denticeps clupeoides TaxID=299321 RepID=A0AAY3ZYB6_9TELE|nr:sialoadhesin-like isoform X2 [Denticeps clupeoides]